MADDVVFQTTTATPPDGTRVSTEEVTTLNGGAVTAQHVQRIIVAFRISDGVGVDIPGTAADGVLVNLGSNNDVTVTSGTITVGAAIPAGNNNIGDVDAIQSGTWTVQPGNTANTTPWLVKETRAATSAVTSVADTASSTTLLASNAARLGATIYNDSTVALYLKLGATASATSFTVKMVADSYYEVPAGYTGVIDGIWTSDASGSARITEITA